MKGPADIEVQGDEAGRGGTDPIRDECRAEGGDRRDSPGVEGFENQAEATRVAEGEQHRRARRKVARKPRPVRGKSPGQPNHLTRSAALRDYCVSQALREGLPASGNEASLLTPPLPVLASGLHALDPDRCPGNRTESARSLGKPRLTLWQGAHGAHELAELGLTLTCAPDEEDRAGCRLLHSRVRKLSLQRSILSVLYGRHRYSAAVVQVRIDTVLPRHRLKPFYSSKGNLLPIGLPPRVATFQTPEGPPPSGQWSAFPAHHGENGRSRLPFAGRGDAQSTTGG